MNTVKVRKFFFCVIPWLAFMLASGVRADDTEIFNNPSSAVGNVPNVVIMLDNTANWNTIFTAQIAALKAVVGSLTDGVAVGLMMFTESGGANKGADGAYVRYPVLPMNATNRAALVSLLNSLHVLNDKSNNGKAALSMHEVYQYFTSAASYAGGPNVGSVANRKVKSDDRAFASPISNGVYSMPTNSCGNNFLIYISNGPVQDNAADTTTAEGKLTTAGGSITPIVVSPNGSQSNASDEWARFMASSSASIISYTVDVLPSAKGQGPGWTALLKSMASVSGGKYYTAGTQADLELTLNNIFTEVQAVNSVFASSSLPVSINVRGSYLNQVYMGVFRPDANSSPTWTGNLKQYKLAPDANDTLILVDKNGAAAENADTGFITPTSTSVWTTSSSFWNTTFYPTVQGSGGASDAPDGDLVEKGGAAQKLRSVYATDVTTRKVYTCLGAGCTNGGALSSMAFNNGNTAITEAMLGAASAADRTSLINWIRGANTLAGVTGRNDNPSSNVAHVRGYVHGDVLHARPAVVNYNRVDGDNDIVVFYGANDGVFRAIKGSQADTDGSELWSFVPTEFYSTLKRLRDASPVIATGSPKPYFFDGPISFWQYDANGDGRYVAADGDKVYVFIGLRRGGRTYYALDVSDPDNPRYLWKITGGSGDFAELGQTWSEPKPAMVRLTGQTNPVLIFGLGYDAVAEDAQPQGTATMGRGVMMVDAETGALVWQTGPITPGTPSSSYKTVAGLTHAIPANLTVLDTNSDGKADRIYAADTGANVWRINIHDVDKANWTVSKVAALGGSGANARKFLYPPDVIYAGTKVAYDTLLIGSGDREHPFENTVVNRYYSIKDNPGLTDVPSSVITEGTAGSNVGTAGQLLDVTNNLIQDGTTAEKTAAQTALNTAAGWYVILSTGEKVVGGTATLDGVAYFPTNIPATYASNSCTGNLGTARIWAVSYLDASSLVDINNNGTLTVADRFQTRAGGGFPPTPVPVSVRINGKDYQTVISGTKVLNPPSPALGRRYRTYWQRLID